MKKGVAFVIGVLLFSMVVLPAMAGGSDVAEEGSEVVDASSNSFTLEIYGNANMDDTIDMRDVTYIKLVIFRKKPETRFCDANYDGKISGLDVVQTKLIIVGKEGKITVINCKSGIPFGRPRPPEVVTIHKPIERCVVLAHAGIAETFRALKSKDKIVGVSKMIKDNVFFYPEISKLPCVGSAFRPDYEAILSLNPDLVLIEPWRQDIIEKLPDIPVAYLGLRMMETYTDGVRKLGYILDKEEEADEYIEWFDSWINKIKSRTEGLSDDEKPRVFITGPGMGAGPGQYTTVSNDNRFGKMCTLAGGKSISADLTGWWIKVDTEWVIEQNPDIIILWINSYHGYDTDDPSELAAIREDIMNRPELANVNAVKTGRVYVSAFGKSYFTHGPGCLIGCAYMAKWFHPDLFEDLDPRTIHQEYLTRFQHLDFNVYEHGVFVYPEPS
ncbi:MAG: ABC transporter substrate-binding protein [Candidatus Methanospirareceae archaeon]